MAVETRSETQADSIFEPIHELITEKMEELKVPGVSLGILHNGQEYLAAFGVTNVDIPSPVITDTLFQIGSNTKTITATGIMRLAEEGKLELDAPARQYVPELKLADEDVAAQVTVRQLLQHVGGWEGDLFRDTGRGTEALAAYIAVMPEFPQQTPLGTVWSYNNAAFSLAGRVIEAVTGKEYEIAIRELVIAPVGMNLSFFFPEEAMLHSFAVGHINADEGVRVARPWPIPRSSNAAGGLACTSRDMLRYARFSMGDGTAEDGTRILSQRALQEMQTPAVSAWSGAHTGLSWFIREVEGMKIVAHGGGTNGQISTFLFAPEENFALVILTNAMKGGTLNRQVEKLVLKSLLGIEDPVPTPIVQSDEQLAQYAGAYVRSTSEVRLSARDGYLFLEMIPKTAGLGDEVPPPPPPARAALYKEDGLLVLEGAYQDVTGEFLRDADGNITWLRVGGRIHRRQS